MYQHSYMFEFTAKIIQKNKGKLFQFQKELVKNGEEQKEMYLRQIRFRAREFIFPNEYKPKTEMIDGKEVQII